MALKIYNSLTRRKDDFAPLDPHGKEVKMYVCGPTVYDEPHIGHLRSACVFDLIRRYLKFSGYEVRFARNVTDVDDKIIEKARASNPKDLNQESARVAQRYWELYKADLGALGVEEPSVEPKATEYLSAMTSLIERLMSSEYAYASGGDVYFDVRKFKTYGKLSGQNTQEMLEHVRKEPLEGKRDPLDFALWKKAKPGEPSWPGPQGALAGRPGWHIECSAMNAQCLGEQIDIHGGGLDLKFPHHENEIAQSEAATGKTFANVWIHHGLITVAGQKMSKSLKNFITLRQLQQRKEILLPAETLKLMFLGTHYRMPLDFTEDAFKMSAAVVKKISNFFDEAKLLKEKGVRPTEGEALKKLNEGFRAAMDDDFNTPGALACVHEAMREAFSAHQSQPGLAMALADQIQGYLRDIFCLDLGLASQTFNNEEALPNPEIEKLIQERQEAKKNKNFAAADNIRQDLLKRLGVELIDTKDGTRWKRVSR